MTINATALQMGISPGGILIPRIASPAAEYRTVVKLSDTQQYPAGETNQGRFTRIIDWIVANKDVENIDFVIHPGDAIDYGINLPLDYAGQGVFLNDSAPFLSAVTPQWTFISGQMTRLEPGEDTVDGIPFCITWGNHDNLFATQQDIDDGKNVPGWDVYFGTNKFTAMETAFSGNDRFFELESESPSGRSHVFRVRIGTTTIRVIAVSYQPEVDETSWAIDQCALYPDIPVRMLTHWWTGDPGVEASIVQEMDTVCPQLFATDQGHVGGNNPDVGVEIDLINSDPENAVLRSTFDVSNFLGTGEPSAEIMRERYYLDESNNVTEVEADIYDVDSGLSRVTAGHFVTRQAFSIASPVPYGLYDTDTQSRGLIQFPVNWPIAPDTGATVLNVTDASSLATAIATDNATIIVAAGSYGTLSFGNDQHWILDDNAVFSLLSAFSFSRVILEGGQIVAGSSGANTLGGYTDLVMRNVNMSGQTFNLAISNGPQRVALIQNTIYSERYGIFTAPAASDGVAGSFDFIIAGNYISGGMTDGDSGVEACTRFQGVNRLVYVDNRLRCGFDGQGTKATLRTHYGTSNVWTRRNLVEYGDGFQMRPRANNAQIQPGNYMGDHWVYDHTHYHSNTNANSYSGDRGVGNTTELPNDLETVWPGTYTCDGLVSYSDLGNGWNISSKAGDSIGSLIENPYQAPPALGSWLTANGIAPGADH